MKTVHRNDGFICTVCGYEVPSAIATCRNHCTECLSSMHVDQELPGDRKSGCRGVLHPIFAEYHAKKGYMIHFRCSTCGSKRRNKAAGDDNMELLAKLIFAANRRSSGLDK